LIWDFWVRYSGYIEYAVSNDVVLLFPQSGYSWFTNPVGCWRNGDELSHTKDGFHGKILMRMIDRLKEK